jgi:glycosyltransferase involved in cell wall biosynthesis
LGNGDIGKWRHWEIGKSKSEEPQEKSEMRISIVTPSLNQCGFIPEMLASLGGQDYPDWEHVVFDAGSTDGSVEVWREWERLENIKTEKLRNLEIKNGGDRGKLKNGEMEKWGNAETERLRNGERLVRVFVEPDRGQSDAINKGMRVATGEIVGWLNADDVLLPGALAKVAETFEKNPDAVVVYGVGAKTDLGGQIIKKVPFREFCHKRLSYAFGAVQPAMFFRRDAYWKVGGLDESLHYAMDWDLLLKLATVGKVVAISDHLANIRYYPETKTNTGGWKRMREIARIARRHNGLLDRNNLSFQIRDLLARQPIGWLRAGFDHICWNLFKDPPLMVQGWPEEKIQN